MNTGLVTLNERREFVWDNFVVDTEKTTARRVLHSPVYRDDVLCFDEMWEGDTVSGINIMFMGGKYRMYYLSENKGKNKFRGEYELGARVCYAESVDGINWTKPKYRLRKYHGTYDNNILLDSTDGDIQSFQVIWDENFWSDNLPCYCGIAVIFTDKGNELVGFESYDGLVFENSYKITDDGVFNSLCSAYWSKEINKYVCLFDGCHMANGKKISDIRIIYSEDLKTWTEPRIINIYDENGMPGEDYPLYTTCAQKYYRGTHLVVALPSAGIEDNGAGISCRTGLLPADCVFMFSRDSENWTRYDDSFIAPGPEVNGLSRYEKCYPASGFAETSAPFDDADKELSLYVVGGEDDEPQKLERYVMRVDGFISMRGDFNSAVLVTKPFIFKGDMLEINFSTSAKGGMHVTLTDNEGNSTTSTKILGNKTDRIIDFENGLRCFEGKPVVMTLELCDAEVYSFRFSENKEKHSIREELRSIADAEDLKKRLL